MGQTEKKVTLFILCTILLVIIVGGLKLQQRQGEMTLTLGVYTGSEWSTSSEGSYEIFDRVIEQFEKDHPQVTVTYISGIPQDEYSEWLSAQMLQGKEPDMYFLLPEDFDLLANAGALEKLDPRMQSDASFDRKAYYEASLKSGEWNGSTYALPIASVPTIMFVNKTFLEERGIATPSDNWTWEDFYDISKAVTNVDNGEFGVYDYTWVDALYANGAQLFSEDGKTCQLADKKVQEAIRFVEKLNDLNEGYQVSSMDFDLGKVAFRPFLYSEYRAYQPYPWRVKKYTNFEWDGIPMPAGPSGKNVSELKTLLLGVSARSKHKDLAWEFVKLFSSNEKLQREFYRNTQGISPLWSVAESGEMINLLGRDIPGGKGFRKETLHEIMTNAVAIPDFKGYEQAMNMAENAVAAEMNGSGTTTENNLLETQRQINRFLVQQ